MELDVPGRGLRGPGCDPAGYRQTLSVELLFYGTKIKVLRPILAGDALKLPVDVDVLRILHVLILLHQLILVISETLHYVLLSD